MINWRTDTADITINDFYAFLLQKTNTIYVAVTDRVAPPKPLFGSQHIWTSSVICYCTDRLPHGIYFLTLQVPLVTKTEFLLTLSVQYQADKK